MISVIKSSALTMLGIAALGIARLVYLSLVGRSVSTETFALVGILISATMTAGLFLPGGIASAAAKFIPQQLGRGSPDAAGAVYRLISFTGYLVSAALAAIVGVGAAVLGVSTWDAFSVGLLTLAFSVYSIEKSALYGFHRVALYVRLELAGSAVAIASTIVVISFHWYAYLLPLVLGYSVLVLGAWVSLRWRARVQPRSPEPVDRPLRREISGYVWLASIGGLASAGLLQALPVLAGALRVEAVAFVTAVGLVAPLYFLPRALGMALFPAMSHAYGAGDLTLVRRHADLTTRALFVLLAPVFAAGIPLARPILVLVYGPRYASGALVLQILLVATFVAMSQVAAVNALSSGSAREVRIPVTSSVAGGVAGILAATPLGLTLGGLGIALAYALATTISASGPLIAVARKHNLPWSAPIARSVAAVLGALAVSVALSTFTHWQLDLIVALATFTAATLLLIRDIRPLLAARVTH